MSQQAGIVIARRDKDRNRTQVLKLLLQKLDRVGGDVIVLIQIAGDSTRSTASRRASSRIPEGAAYRLTFPVTEAGGETGGGKAGIEMDIRGVNETDGCHQSQSRAYHAMSTRRRAFCLASSIHT